MNKVIENVWAMQNELRNQEGITGIDSMHHILMVLLSKSFTIHQCHILGIPEEFAFENIIQLDSANDMYNIFYNTRNYANCIVKYIRTPDTFGYSKDLPFSIKKSSTLEYMIHKVNNIHTSELMNSYDLIGDIYEHFINRESKTMKDLGQYFTDRQLIRYLVDLVNPSCCDEGVVPTVWDPAAGTGGFLIEYIHHLNKQADINWNINKSNLYANDINMNTYSLLKQNLYYSLNQTSGPSIKMLDSLTTNDDLTYDYIFANPPFGIKGLKYKDMCDKIKALGINGTKGEILFLQLCMAKLNENGKCIIVIPEGVLFNSTKMYKETRKYLMTHFNLSKVIKVGEGEFFKNTGVKTSVLHFQKKGTTQNVEFIQVNKVGNSIEEVPLMTVEMEKIIENDYSLNMNLYKEITYIQNSDFDIKQLDEITYSQKGQPIKVKGENLTGDYPIISGGTNICGYYDKFNRESNTILLSSSGQAGYVSKYNSKIWASDCWSIHSNNIDYLTNDYLYHCLKYMQQIIYEYRTGAVIKHLCFKDIKHLKIPIPPLEVQNRIVEQLNNIYETEIKNSQTLIDSLKTSIETIMKNTLYRDDLQEYKIKDIVNTKRGNLCNPSENEEENIYPYYAGNKISGYVNTYEFSGPSIMMNYRLSLGCKRPCQYIREGDYNCSRFSWVCTLNSENMLSYIYNYFNNIIHYDDLLVGSTILEINQKNLGNYKIHIPPLEVQKELLEKIEPKESLIHDLQNNITRAENEAKDIMNHLFN